jgi:hypothetical protein
MPAPAAKAAARKPAGKENVLTRKIGPLPTWAWTAIAAAVLLLLVMWRGNKSSGSGQGGAKGHGFTGALVPPVILHGHKERHRHKHHGGDPGGKKIGPERQWLINKTGSKHPWSFLARHDETIEVGPHGSRIVHGRKAKKGKHEPDEKDKDHAAKPRALRGLPEQGSGPVPVKGDLMSFTTPETGDTPSLAQVASQYNTAPDAIIEEATGRGNPHGAMWRRYVAIHDWDAPLPHGTDMTVLAQPG